MADNIENLVLEILRQLRGDITSLRNEVREGFNRVEIRLGNVEQSLASIFGVVFRLKAGLRTPNLMAVTQSMGTIGNLKRDRVCNPCAPAKAKTGKS